MQKKNIAQIKQQVDGIFLSLVEPLIGGTLTSKDKQALFKTCQNLIQPEWKRIEKRLSKQPDAKSLEHIQEIKDAQVKIRKQLKGALKNLRGEHGAPPRALTPVKAREALAFANTLVGHGSSLKAALQEAGRKFGKNENEPISLRTMYREWKNRKEYFASND